jgi:signal transduction histidine kinase/ligand-binding sensor domain-containing protein
LSDDEITALYQDKDGVLWIGTGGGGLDKHVPSTGSEAEGLDRENEHFIHYQHNPDDPQSLSSNAVSVIYQDRNGVLWIGTEGGGLNRLVLSEVEGSERENERWRHYANDPSDPNSLSHNAITAISEDQSGALWVGTGGGGVNRLDQENERFIHYQNDPDDQRSLSSDDVSAIYQDRDGVLWIGTRDAGINWFNPETETFVHYQNVPGDAHSLSNNLVLSIFQDREGGLWFGTIGGGVNKQNMGWRNFALYQNDPEDPNSLGDNMVRAFYQEDHSALWIGTMFGGIDRFDRETGNWRHHRHDPDDPGSLSDDWISAIHKDSSGVLWIGTASGLDKFDPETETFTHYQADPDGPPGSPSNNVRTIDEGQEGEFWIGTKGGLYRFDRQEENWSHRYHHDPGDPDSLSDNWVFSFLEDSEGIIWIGTLSGGLNRFDPEKETFAHYQKVPGDPQSLSSNIVVSIVQDREGTLWIGNSGGIDKFDPATETFSHYREKDGMPNNSVYCIVEDGGGHLWVSTNKGLSNFDPQGETFRNYDVTNGLQSNEFNSIACLMGDNEEIFFGGIDGFNTFFPDQVQDNHTIPPVVLTSLAHGGEQVNLGHNGDSLTEVTLNWPEDAFEFEFAALSFADPEKNQYAYYLEGFEETWNDVGTRRYGQYTHLPGGTYTLRVKGSNSDGVWNEVGTTVEITVVPPFWETWWFRGILFMTLVGVVFGVFRLRVRNFEARSRELEAQVEERAAELQSEIDQRMQVEEALRESEMEKAVAEERSRLARELHDSVTQSLYSLTLFTEAARHMVEDIGEENIEQYIGQIGVIGQQALKEMRLLVYELQPPELEREGLVRALRKRLEAVEGRAGVEARLEVDEFVKLPGNVEGELYRIAQEALNNALKHAAAGSVVLYLRQSNGNFEMEIVDDGVGFDPEATPDRGGLGLKSIRDRAEHIGGSVTIRSQPGEGTSVKVSVPQITANDQKTETGLK